ncbi:MAG: hypothetical protein VB119_06840 [Candidatus Metalachnospira sp.]|nr:hypothetical protein [Candidatus Metalachnospira sp.]
MTYTRLKKLITSGSYDKDDMLNKLAYFLWLAVLRKRSIMCLLT